ncbi:MAG: hypothetical protein C0506_15745 [Anaerolinea sp.]|nr:hypothetical protein [Anaerolinea sp.]
MAPSDVEFERNVRIHEVRGRIDALLGRTIFEFKSNLKAEMGDARKQLLDYLTEREEASGDRYIGIATDGAEFRVFERYAGALVEIGAPFLTPRDQPRRLLDWLESTVAARDDVAPEPETISFELGRKSVAYGIARRELGTMWAAVCAVPDVVLKRQLWAQQLERAYGSAIESDELFFQHTYLTIVAKTMATAVVGIPLPPPGDFLSGRAFEEAAISGAVESDFFDWLLEAPESGPLITRIARQVMRFRLRDAQWTY